MHKNPLETFRAWVYSVIKFNAVINMTFVIMDK